VHASALPSPATRSVGAKSYLPRCSTAIARCIWPESLPPPSSSAPASMGPTDHRPDARAGPGRCRAGLRRAGRTPEWVNGRLPGVQVLRPRRTTPFVCVSWAPHFGWHVFQIVGPGTSRFEVANPDPRLTSFNLAYGGVRASIGIGQHRVTGVGYIPFELPPSCLWVITNSAMS
jgi:hypothetical protein